MKKIILCMIFMNIFSLFALPVMKYIPEGKYKIDDVLIEQESFYVSETKITIGEFKKYLEETNASLMEKFYLEMEFFVDDENAVLDDFYPVFGLNYYDLVDYCNWLSEKENLQKCYLKENINGDDVIKTNYEANGYRLPTLREWYYISELWMNKDASYYESVNILKGRKYKMRSVPYSINDELYNSFGIKDPLGNLPEFCNDYYLADKNFELLKTNKYGPSFYTNNPDDVFFQTSITGVYVYVGGWYGTTYLKMKENFLSYLYNFSTGFISFRVVKKAVK